MYYMTAMRVMYPRCFIGTIIFMEIHRRILKGEFGTIPKPISDDAFAQGGYCLDAPEMLPAGACFNEQVSEEDSIPSQITVEREAP